MGILGLVVFGAMASLVATGEMEPEAAILRWLAGQRSSFWTVLMVGITRVGTGPVTAIMTSILCLWLWAKKQHRNAVFLAAANFGGAVLNATLKAIFERQRPSGQLVSAFVDPQTFSFPSGHAMSAMIFYASVSIVAARLGAPRLRAFVYVLAIIMIPTMGFTRLYLGVHYPSDVVGGWAMGAAWVAFIYLLFDGGERVGA